MAELYTYNSTHLSTIRDGTVELTQSAEAGAIGTGRFTIDDTAGTLNITGQKDFLYTQSSASSNTRVFRGFIGDRQYGRDSGEERAPHVSKGRGIAVTVEDLNSTLGFRVIHRQDGMTAAQAGNRPAETVAARAAWLMASPFVSGLFSDNGRCSFPATKGMDKADYRNQYPGDVLADMALAAGGYNYHVQDYGSGPELIFRDDNASTADSSSLRISNVSTDIDSWHDTVGATSTFGPSVDAVLTRRPGQVISKVGVASSKGTTFRERAATATAFNGERSQIASNANIKSFAKAADEGDNILWQRSTEEDSIDCTIQVPSSAVNLIPAGWRIQAKFEHYTTEGYGSFTWFRVVERTVRPMNAEAASYEIDLRLVPQEAAQPAGAIVQSFFQFTGTGGSGFPPYSHLANPPSIGNVLLVAISKRAHHPAAVSINPPNTDPDRPRWGAGAWTELPLDVGGFADTYVENTAGDGTKHAVTFYWKEVDSTDQDCAILNDYQNVGVWELSGIDMATATLARANNQAAATTMDAGTLGTVASGELAFMISHSSPDMTTLATVTPDTGWVTDWYRGSYPIWYAQATFPVVWMGHAIGAGSTVNPSITLSGSGRRWCGLAIKVGP